MESILRDNKQKKDYPIHNGDSSLFEDSSYIRLIKKEYHKKEKELVDIKKLAFQLFCLNEITKDEFTFIINE